jgi:hypothetical protein
MLFLQFIGYTLRVKDWMLFHGRVVIDNPTDGLP